jgi:hypothetical protein
VDWLAIVRLNLAVLAPARRDRTPLAPFEIRAHAGLNLMPEQFRYH